MEIVFSVLAMLRGHPINGGNGTSKDGLDYNLFVSENLDPTFYLSPDGLPNQLGSQIITEVLTDAISAHIKMCNQQGFKKDFVHLKEIMDKLQQDFVTDGEVFKSEFGGSKDKQS